jgi:uncharacterized protein (TIGR02271 family)
MAAPETVQVTGPGSLRGTIDTGAWPLDSRQAQVVVQLDDGTSVLVPRGVLVQQQDGGYHMILDPAMLERRDASGEAGGSPLVVPVIEEVIEVHTTPVETGRVRIRKIVHEREEMVDPPLLREEVVIERVPVNRMVDGPIAAYSEEDTLIIPVLEEVLVIEKRLVLKEEVRITKRRVETHRPQRVILRREEATLERLNHESDNSNPCTEEHHDV